MVLQYNDEKIDSKTQLILHKIKEKNGVATTNDIKRLTGLDNDKISRRFKKIDHAGLLESMRKVEFRGHLQQWEVSLNDEGRTVADRLDITGRADGLTVTEEIERLERQNGRLEQEIRELRFEMKTLEERVDAINEYFDRKGVALPR